MWYYIKNNKQIGPVSHDEICTMIQNSIIVYKTPVWKNGMQNWEVAGNCELRQYFDEPPPFNNIPLYSTKNSIYDQDSFRTIWLWFAWLVGIGYFLPLLSMFGILGSYEDLFTIIFIIGILILIAGIVLSYILLYRYWHVIQDGNARTSPEKAVGFCFIPFFNFYWLYVAFVGLAKDMNRYCYDHNIPSQEINIGLAISTYILFLCAFIPFINIVTTIANIIVVVILYNQFSKSAIQIVNYKRQNQTQIGNLSGLTLPLSLRD